MTVVADPVEQLIADAVLIRLSSPDLAHALAGRASADEQSAALAEQIAADRDQLDELATMYGTKDITAKEWMSAQSPIEQRLRDSERRLSRATSTSALDGLIGLGGALGAQWADLNLDRQHAVITTLLDHAVITPGTPGARSLDPARVQPHWRF